MDFLKFLESVRTPWADSFFSFITRFGEEYIFIIISFFLFWCVSKNKGYYCLVVGFWGLLANQFMKIAFRVPRPWVIDKNFTIVESARAEATGYSFPSGHTQISVGTYSSLARAFKNLIVRILCIALCILVPLSRLYLGVHTPLDVGVSVAVALALTFFFYPVMMKIVDRKNAMRVLFSIMLAAAAAFVLYTELFPFPKNIDSANLSSAVENAYKILGVVFGVWLGYEIDKKYINFKTDALWWVQIIKLVFGTLIVLAIKDGLKAPLGTLFSNHAVSGAIRYFLITFFACGIWPVTFSFFSHIGKRQTKE